MPTVLGQFPTDAESIGSSSTTSGTYVNKVTLNTPSVPAGDYLIHASCHYQVPTGPEDFQLELEEDSATQIYETGRLHEIASFNVVCMVRAAVQRTLTAGTHQYDMNFRRVDGSNAVVIQAARLHFFRLDGTYQQAISSGVSSAGSTAYQLKVSLNTGAIPAGFYRLGMTTEYRNEVAPPSGGCALRFRMRKDPAGADTITNLLGTDSGGGQELFINNGGLGIAATDPWMYASWWRPCLYLEADTYQFELHWREETGGNEVELQKSRIHFYKVL